LTVTSRRPPDPGLPFFNEFGSFIRGPRLTPTVLSNDIVRLGNCLDLQNGDELIHTLKWSDPRQLTGHAVAL